jgi:hypothetical protein
MTYKRSLAGKKKLRIGSKDAKRTGKLRPVSAESVARLKASKMKLGARVFINVPSPGNLQTRHLKFGAVTVSNTAPDKATVAANVTAGRDALRRAGEALVKPGVKLQLRPEVPRFRADASERGMLIRELNGTEQRGRIVNGTFVPAD